MRLVALRTPSQGRPRRLRPPSGADQRTAEQGSRRFGRGTSQFPYRAERVGRLERPDAQSSDLHLKLFKVSGFIEWLYQLVLDFEVFLSMYRESYAMNDVNKFVLICG